MKTLLAMTHYDDEVISSAEYLLRHPDSVIFTACGGNSIRQPAFEAVLNSTGCTSASCQHDDLTLLSTCIPDIATFVAHLIANQGIERVITHHPADVHQDHRIVAQAVQIALRRFENVELLYNKNPEGFPFTEVHWDTVLARSDEAHRLIDLYKPVVANLPHCNYEYYQSVRRFSI